MNKLISEEEKYNGKVFKVVKRIYENKDGHEYVRDCILARKAAVVLALDENDNVIFVKQNREVIGMETLELPAGIIEEGEEPVAAAKRELEEETGLIANEIEYLGECYPSCGITDEKIYIFCASKLERGARRFDDDEQINSILRIPLKRCYEMLINNKFIHASQNLAFSSYYFKKMNKI